MFSKFFIAKSKVQSNMFSKRSMNNFVGGNVSINGSIYKGNNISIMGNKIFIDGKDQTPNTKEIHIEVTGNIQTLEMDVGSVNVKGDVTKLSVDTGDVEVEGNVLGSVNVDTGNVKCGNVEGKVTVDVGNINYKK